VLELGGGVASAFAGRLLGDHGADVLKVEPTGGDPLRARGPFPDGRPDPEGSGTFLTLNLNKRGVTLESMEPASLAALLSWADVLIHDFPRQQASALRLDPDSLARDHARLVTLALTPFGHSGPHAHYQAEELTVANAGGWAHLCPSTHTDPSLPPLKVAGDQCALMSGIAGALCALAFAREARRSGVGEHIDLSQQEYVASVLEVAIPAFSYRGDVVARYHERSLIPWRIFQAQDAPVFIVCVEQDQWERLVEFMGNPEWASLEIFADLAGRSANQDMVHTLVQEFVSQWRAEDLYHAAQARRICVAPVLGFREIESNPHLKARDFFTRVTRGDAAPLEHLAPAVLTSSGRAPIRHPAPFLGQHNSALEGLPARSPETSVEAPRLPLADVRVLDLTWAWAGPFCSLNLAHLGAEVIRIESAIRADLYRRLPVHPPDWPPSLNISGMFNQWNQGKSSIAIDLSREEGLQIVRDLVAESDVVVQNFATGVMERLGLGYEVLKSINPGIILASISGYGQTGPWRDYIGYGPAIPPLTGLAVGTGYLDGAAEETGLSMPDPTAGVTAALAVVSALLRRAETGQGDHLDVTLWEATGVLNLEAWADYVMNGNEPQRTGNRHPTMAPHGCFPCRGEDAWVSIACRSDQEWRRLATCIDPALAGDSRFATLAGRKQHEGELEVRIAAWTKALDRWAVTTELQDLRIAAFPAFTPRDVVEDKHLNERGFIERLAHPEVGERAHTGIPWRLTNRPNGVSAPAPCLGADTDRHLRDILGMNEETIASLYQAGVLGV
jgi:crotonobetainyl-CoA:carnitine CoA-transferase CaiB-like acyl-CoA transferase